MLIPKAVKSSLSALRATRAQYLEAVERVDAAILALERIAEPVGRTDRKDVKVAPAAVRVASVRQKIVSKPTQFRGMGYGNAVEVALRLGNRRAFSTRQLIEILQAGGRTVKGKRPYRTIYGTLKKNPKFRNIKGKWGLSAWYDNQSAETEEREDAATVPS